MNRQRTKSGTFARHTKLTHKSELCKRSLPCANASGTHPASLDKGFQSILQDEGHTYNNRIAKSGGRHYSASAVVPLISLSYRGDRILLSYKCYLRQ